jgi:hypothetical protein
LSATIAVRRAFLRANQVELGVGHVDLGSRDVRLRAGADFEESLRGAQVQLGALLGLLLHANERWLNSVSRVRFLHRRRDQLPLQLDVLHLDLGQLRRPFGFREILPKSNRS